MKNTLIILLIPFLFSCGQTCERANETKETILLADREAPIGWVYLRIFKDSTFEFETRGFRTCNIYSGTAKIIQDTIYFNYSDSIPKAGTTAIYSDNSVEYINGKYAERVDIKLSKLSHNQLKISDLEYFNIRQSISNKDSLLKVKPIDFLKSLTHRKLEKGTKTNKIINTLTFNNTIQNEWVTKQDVEQLIELIYNQDIAETPWPMISSQMPMINSTVGIEAMHLITIYKDSTFHYPSMCSTYYLCKPEEQNEKAKEFDKWWKEHNKE